VLKRIFGQKMDEVAVDGRILHNVELHNLHSPPGIIRMIIKSRRMRWEGHVARKERSGMHIEYWSESQKKSEYLAE
jgi:hypothetical protein